MPFTTVLLIKRQKIREVKQIDTHLPSDREEGCPHGSSSRARCSSASCFLDSWASQLQVLLWVLSASKHCSSAFWARGCTAKDQKGKTKFLLRNLELWSDEKEWYEARRDRSSFWLSARLCSKLCFSYNSKSRALSRVEWKSENLKLFSKFKLTFK